MLYGLLVSTMLVSQSYRLQGLQKCLKGSGAPMQPERSYVGYFAEKYEL